MPKGRGLVTPSTLQKAIFDHGVQMSTNEFKTLVQLFSKEIEEGDHPVLVVDYERMSVDLGLHSSKLSHI